MYISFSSCHTLDYKLADLDGGYHELLKPKEK